MLPGGGFYPLKKRTWTPLVPRQELGGNHLKSLMIISFTAKMCSTWETRVAAEISLNLSGPTSPIKNPRSVTVGILLSFFFFPNSSVNTIPLVQRTKMWGIWWLLQGSRADLPAAKCKYPHIKYSSALLEIMRDLMALNIVCLCLLPR